MKIFIRDMIIGTTVFFLTLAAMGWWNKPAYQVCAKSHSQEFCYMVLK